MSLSREDRYLRFGYAVQDEQIRRYVSGLNLTRDEVFGIFDRKLALLAVAHLAYSDLKISDGCAEFGVSVVPRARGRGYGRRLFDLAAIHASNQCVRTMFIQALAENAPMLSIARAAGARIKREGAESEAYLQLAGPSLHSRLNALIQQQIATTDYQLKLQAKLFWNWLANMQALRRAVSEAQRNNPH